MHFLVIDHQITRRKRYHFLLDENEKILWRGRYVGDCLEFMAANEISRVIAIDGKIAYRLDARLTNYEEEVAPWLRLQPHS